MKPVALIVPASIKSHVLPSLFLADLLADKYEVNYGVTTEILKEIVEKNDYKAQIISPFKIGIGVEGRFISEVKKEEISFLRLVKAYLKNEVNEFRNKEYDKIIADLKPSLIILDIFNSTDFVTLYPKTEEIKICMFNPMPSTFRVGDYPIVSEGIWLKNSGGFEVKKKRRIGIIDFLKQPKKSIINYLILNQIPKLSKMNDIAQKYKQLPNDFTVSFDDVPELILAPLEFEVSLEIRKPFQHYLGLCQLENRIDTELDEKFENYWSEILKQKNQGKRIIYCSFGTYYEGPDRKLLDFLQTIIEAISQLEDAFLVISVNRFVIEYIESQPINLENVAFFRKVPQLKVLEKADLYITHGGFGGIKEALHYKVPMLVYPLDMHYDQNGNAFKIEHFGLGKRGIFGFERLENMKAKIIDLLERPVFKSKIEEFKKKIDKNYTTKKLKQTLIEIGI